MDDSLYSGTLQMLVEDLGVEEIVCFRLKSMDGKYPIVTYRDALYTQLHASDIGRSILFVREVKLEELTGPSLAGIYEQYCQESFDPGGSRLAAASSRHGIKLYLHTMDDQTVRLVIAVELEVQWMPSPEFRYWEHGYTYRDVYLDYSIPPPD